MATAEARFRHYGYGKTTVADIAEDLKVSTAYIYKFFDSKTAICEAVCGATLARIDQALWAVARSDLPPPERLARLYETLLGKSVELFFNERKLHDMVHAAMDHDWGSVDRHKQAMRDTAALVIAEGRASGDFESETPLEDAAAATACTMIAFAHPGVLEHSIDRADMSESVRVVVQLVLRGLARRS